MKTRSPQIALLKATALVIGLSLIAPLALAQGSVVEEATTNSLASFRIAPSSVLNEDAPLISIARNVEEKDFQGNMVESALNFNLGVQLSPIEGFNVRADAWRMEVGDVPAATVNAGVANGSDWQSGLPRLYLEDPGINEFNLDNPLLSTNIESNGFDLGASYVWETNRFGQFTLSSKTTYVDSFENSSNLLELVSSELSTVDEQMISPELQSSLMLSWQFGNHTASAITNYFDSFKDISELDIQEINDLVDNMTTVDLQYGYSVETGSNDRASISFGIRNSFDEKTTQSLNSTTRSRDQNGRVADGSIKDQF